MHSTKYVCIFVQIQIVLNCVVVVQSIYSCYSVLGVLSVAKEASHGKFTTADEGMLTHFSDYAGLACITHKVCAHVCTVNV